MNPDKIISSKNVSTDHPYIYVSYEVSHLYGYVAVIDPVKERIIKRIQVGVKPGPMCMDPAETKLFVINTGNDSVTIIDTDTFKILNTVPIGDPLTKSYPNSIFAAPKGNKVYVAHDTGFTIIDSLSNEVIKELELTGGIDHPFAFLGNVNSSFVYAACASNDSVAISIDNDRIHRFEDRFEVTFDGIHNPFAVHPDGHTEISFGPSGWLTYFDADLIESTSTSSLLDNTVSGIYLDNKLLFCTMREDKNYLKIFKNLEIKQNGYITYDSFSEYRSYKGQDKIRPSRKQLYIGVTVQPVGSQTGGLQIINLNEGSTEFVPLPSVGDLAFYSDTRAYVGELNAVRPIDLATATPLRAIELGDEYTTVKNIISGYSKQSLKRKGEFIMNPNKEHTNHNRSLPSVDPYIFVTYTVNYLYGYVAVIDPIKDQLIKRIPVGMNPGPMAMDPTEKKLYVLNTGSDMVTIIDTNTFNILDTVFVGNDNSTPSDPVAVFVAPHSDKAYVANSSNRDVTIINTSTNKVITKVDMGPGKPFAFAGNEHSSYVYAACRVADGDDYVVAISIKDDTAYLYGIEYELTFDGIRNPLTVHPDGHTQITMGTNGILCFFDGEVKGQPATFSLLDNTVSGVYLDNKLLFCTSQEGKSYLKRMTDLTVSANGQIAYDNFKDINSFKGQDKIRASRNQKYIGVTIQPTTRPLGGLQIYNVTNSQSRYVSLASVGDLAFFSDTKAYVGELQAIRPIDLNTATTLPAIELGSYDTVPVQIQNIVSGYRNQS